MSARVAGDFEREARELGQQVQKLKVSDVWLYLILPFRLPCHASPDQGENISC